MKNSSLQQAIELAAEVRKVLGMKKPSEAALDLYNEEVEDWNR